MYTTLNSKREKKTIQNINKNKRQKKKEKHKHQQT